MDHLSLLNIEQGDLLIPFSSTEVDKNLVLQKLKFYFDFQVIFVWALRIFDTRRMPQGGINC
jgi:hypothetical protein